MKAHCNSVFSRLICTFIILSISLCSTSAYAANEIPAIRVGFFAYDGYHMQDTNGVRSGYGYDILQHLAGYGGFRYEYVGYDKSFAEMQDMLESGEIDLLTSAQKTPEREARFDFSQNIGSSSTILTVKSGDQRFLKDDYSNWNGIRVGIIEDNSRNDGFKEFAQEHGFTYVPVLFEDLNEMIAELKSDSSDKKIDAILTSSLRRINGESIRLQFDSAPFYVMVKKGNTDLLDRIDAAIEHLDSSEPGIRTKLTNTYYKPSSSEEIAFTPEERAFIQEMQGTTFTALINPDCAPYSWVENGELTGILHKVAQEIILTSGLNIEFIEADSREKVLQLIESKDADIRFDATYNYNQAEQDGYWLTAPYVTIPLARLYKENTTSFKTAALPSNRDIEEQYTALLENRGIAVTWYPSVDEVVSAVMHGTQDTAYLMLDSAAMAVRDDLTNRLIAEEIFGYNLSYSVAVSQDQNPLLFSIISKTVASLGDDTVDSIRQDYAQNLKKPFSLIGYFYDYPMRVIIVAVAFLVAVIALILLISRSRRLKAEFEYLKKESASTVLLKEALDSAERAGAAKSQFLSRVSHEMRTPLNAIIGFIELARDADETTRENYMASCTIAAKQLLSVINDVLDMSSIESGKMKIANAPFNFKHLISSITNIYGLQCEQKGINFETKITSPISDWLVGDEMRINQILMNLLGNAVKFTVSGHIWLNISQMSSNEDEVFIRFEVSDTGTGISDELKERLFKPFEQESSSTAKKFGGSGLGLSIVKNLASLMHGTVTVESKQGEGTTFIVDLPFGRSDVGLSETLPTTIDSLRVLAVDDEDAEREYMTIVLQRMKIRFTYVGSGPEALAALDQADHENDPYNVCIVDWRMPGMDGFDTTLGIRRKYGKDVIVIVFSAYEYQLAGENAKRAGANLFLSKPLFQSSLYDLFMTLTRGKIAEPQQEGQVWDFSGRRLLLAEDNALNQIVAKGFLSKFSVEVDLAVNGQMAVEMFCASEPDYYDAILMDIQMPVMDGLEATQAIRRSTHPNAKTIQIIAQTADAFSEDITRVLAAGMNAHIAKPIESELLAKTLYKAFTIKK